MSPADFTAWRKRLGLTKIAAAEALGISPESIANYEKGRRSDSKKPVLIPKVVALACGAVAYGLKPYGE